MKGGFAITDVFAQFDSIKEIAVIASIAVQRTYAEAVAIDPKLAMFMTEPEYIQLVAKIYRLANELHIMNKNGFLTPEAVRSQFSV